MGNEPGPTIKPEACLQMREILRPCIVGLGPKDLYVKPLIRCNETQKVRLEIKDSMYCAGRKRFIALPSIHSRERRQKSGTTDRSCSNEFDMGGLSYMRIGGL